MAGMHAMPRDEQRAKRKQAHNQERPHGHWWQRGRRFGRKQAPAPVKAVDVPEAPIVTEVPEVAVQPTGEYAALLVANTLQTRFPDLAIGKVEWSPAGRDDELGVEMLVGEVSPALSDDIRRHLINLFGIVLEAEPSTQLLADGDAELSVVGMYEGVQVGVWAAVPAEEREEPIPLVPVEVSEEMPVLYRQAAAGFDTQSFRAVSADEPIPDPAEVALVAPAELEEVA